MEQLIEILTALFSQLAIWFAELIEWITGLIGTI
jgi:hypothetical protein